MFKHAPRACVHAAAAAVQAIRFDARNSFTKTQARNKTVCALQLQLEITHDWHALGQRAALECMAQRTRLTNKCRG